MIHSVYELSRQGSRTCDNAPVTFSPPLHKCLCPSVRGPWLGPSNPCKPPPPTTTMPFPASLIFHTDSYLLDQTFAYLHDTCRPSELYCPDNPDHWHLPCSHTADIARCLVVSKAWFNAGVRHLWQNYAKNVVPLRIMAPGV
jgi:hypothetical protein